jgi:histidyl-tRNA synthetase
MGIERAIIVLDESGAWDGGTRPHAFVVQATESAFKACQATVRNLRSAGLTALSDIDSKSMKSQMRQADKSGAAVALIIGDDEIRRNTVQIKRLGSSEQVEIAVEDLLQKVLELQ